MGGKTDNLLSGDLSDHPVAPKDHSKPADYARNKKGLYDGKPGEREKRQKD